MRAKQYVDPMNKNINKVELQSALVSCELSSSYVSCVWVLLSLVYTYQYTCFAFCCNCQY